MLQIWTWEPKTNVKIQSQNERFQLDLGGLEVNFGQDHIWNLNKGRVQIIKMEI